MQPVSMRSRELAEHVRVELRRVRGLDPSAIAVSAHHGRVTLHGRVRTLAERDEAVRAARRVPGVRSIDSAPLRGETP